MGTLKLQYTLYHTQSSIGVKPIVLDLELSESVIKDVMTSSKHFGDNRSAYNESERIANILVNSGFNVLRKKIETVPWHPAAPSDLKSGEIENGCYFESHMGVLIDPENKSYLTSFVNDLQKFELMHQLKDIGANVGSIKLSRNFFKKSEDGKFVNLITYRSNLDGSVKFKQSVDRIKETLIGLGGFTMTDKIEVEFAIYDTNVSHDALWIKGDKLVM